MTMYMDLSFFFLYLHNLKDWITDCYNLTTVSEASSDWMIARNPKSLPS